MALVLLEHLSRGGESPSLNSFDNTFDQLFLLVLTCFCCLQRLENTCFHYREIHGEKFFFFSFFFIFPLLRPTSCLKEVFN